MARLSLRFGYKYLRQHGRSDGALAIERSTERIPEVSQAQLKRARVLYVIEHAGLTEDFLREHAAELGEEVDKVHLKNLRSAYRRFEVYDPSASSENLRQPSAPVRDPVLEAHNERWQAWAEGRASPASWWQSKPKKQYGIGSWLIAGIVVVLFIGAVMKGTNEGEPSTSSTRFDPCDGEGGSSTGWVNEDGSGPIYRANPHMAGVNKVVVCAGSGRPVSVNDQPIRQR